MIEEWPVIGGLYNTGAAGWMFIGAATVLGMWFPHEEDIPAKLTYGGLLLVATTLLMSSCNATHSAAPVPHTVNDDQHTYQIP